MHNKSDSALLESVRRQVQGSRSLKPASKDATPFRTLTKHVDFARTVNKGGGSGTPDNNKQSILEENESDDQFFANNSRKKSKTVKETRTNIIKPKEP